MDSETIEKFKLRLSNLNDALNMSNFAGASAISGDIIRVSVFLDIPDFIYIGEFFESIFDNLNDIDRLFEFEQETKNDLNQQINYLINEIKNNIPFEDTDSKVVLFDNLVKLRSNVTKIQVQYRTIGKRKKEISSLKEFPRLTID